MDDECKSRLLDKKYIGARLKAFWEANGFATMKELREKSSVTALHAYLNGISFPGWDALVRIADACGRDLAHLIDFIDPHPTVIPGTRIQPKPEHLHIYENLDDILTGGDPRKIQMIDNLSAMIARAQDGELGEQKEKGRPSGARRKKRRIG